MYVGYALGTFNFNLNNEMIFTLGSCSDVYVGDCVISCGDTKEFNKPTLVLCQLECALNELCASWTYDQTSQVNYHHYLMISILISITSMV